MKKTATIQLPEDFNTARAILIDINRKDKTPEIEYDDGELELMELWGKMPSIIAEDSSTELKYRVIYRKDALKIEVSRYPERQAILAWNEIATALNKRKRK